MVSNRRTLIDTSPTPQPPNASPPTAPTIHSRPSRQHIHRPPFKPVATFDTKIVFNFFRAEDFRLREVVSIRDLVDNGKGPSWEKLVEILSAKKMDSTSLFDEKNDMMLFDQRICVQGERQFLAAIQWMSNMEEGSRNVNVPIHEASEAARAKLWPKGVR